MKLFCSRKHFSQVAFMQVLLTIPPRPGIIPGRMPIPGGLFRGPCRPKLESNGCPNGDGPPHRFLMSGKGPLIPGCGPHIPGTGIWFGLLISPVPLNPRGGIHRTSCMNGLLNPLQNRQKNKC